MYTYDLLIKGGRVFDTESGTFSSNDIAINGDQIVAVAPDIRRALALRIIEAEGGLVTPGLIDLHAHIADGITRHGINPDRAGVLQGVTTIADGGSVGSHTFVGFRRHVLPHTRTRVFTFLNLSYSGQAWMPELRSLADLDEETLCLVMTSNRDVVKGVKIRCVSPMVSTVGSPVLEIAHRHADLVGGRVMVHIGDHGDHDGEGDALPVTRRVMDGLRAGDIITHPYTHWPGGAIDANGDPLPEAVAAAERGVVIDVGRGMMNFTFDKARRGLEKGLIPTTISTDITLMTINGPVFGLADTASIFLNLGMSLPDVLVRITRNPAQALGIADEVGTISVGRKADLTILEHRDAGSYLFHGFEGEQMTGNQLLIPHTTIKSGVPIACELPYGSAMRTAVDAR